MTSVPGLAKGKARGVRESFKEHRLHAGHSSQDLGDLHRLGGKVSTCQRIQMREVVFLFLRLADFKNNNDYYHYCWNLYSIHCLPDTILTSLY